MREMVFRGQGPLGHGGYFLAMTARSKCPRARGATCGGLARAARTLAAPPSWLATESLVARTRLLLFLHSCSTAA